MALRSPPNSRNNILYVTFNQDCTCIALGTQQGISIFNLETHKICYKYPVGAVSIAEMLFCTSLVAFVGAGDQPALTPRKLTVMNTSTNKVIQDINFTTSVLSVLMNRQRLVVVLERKAYVYALQTLALLRALETPDNPRGVAALCSANEPVGLLALPSSSSSGTLRVYDLLVDGGNVLCEINAHRTPLDVMAWNHDGTLLASASHKGTVIRVHRLPHASKAYTFRRGTYPATVHALAFSPQGIEPQLLCASSSHGTVHLFRLGQPERHAAAVAASAAAGILSAVMKYSVSDMVEPLRSIANVKLPCQGVAATCAIVPSRGQQQEGSGSSTTARNCADSVMIVVATLEGLLYEYSIEDLSNPAGPKCSLEGEWALLGSLAHLATPA